MKVYKITAECYVDDETSEEKIKGLIQRDLNCGEGIFLDTDSAKIKLIRKEED